ncbi:MAG TPA: radical SAM family heme chaperone HemW [Phycisphaerae bacterium]|nr:radical SAM family heme chaperone HemW [Phycisphaerae bacterium]
MAQCGLYLHVPFCSHKCGYCDFYSVPESAHDTGPLVDRLLDELRTRLNSTHDPITTMFIGGGTPTVLSPDLLARLLEPLTPIAAQPPCIEFTIEANPGTLDDAKVRILARSGVDRISLGAQSFQPGELATLERGHRPDDVAPAVEAARRAGIRRINLDLIFGIPGQTLTTWTDSIDRAIALGVDHLALYGLTYEPGTPLTRRLEAGRIQRCPEQLEREMYLTAVRRAAARGFEQYEISNFARPDHRCRHNLLYWNNEPYIGVGPSAVGCIDGVRYRNVPDIERYVRMIDKSGSAVIETERVTGHRLAAEMVMLRLRLVEGIDAAEFEARAGWNPHTAFAGAIQRCRNLGLLRVTPTHIALTDEGRLLADSIITEFMAELDEPASRPAPI